MTLLPMFFFMQSMPGELLFDWFLVPTTKIHGYSLEAFPGCLLLWTLKLEIS